MALANDNYIGYIFETIARYKVRWIELAAVLPIWTHMVVYYVEGDYGHLMSEELGRQAFRTRVRGGCCSFHMPWDDIVQSLLRSCSDEDLTELPRPQAPGPGTACAWSSRS